MLYLQLIARCLTLATNNKRHRLSWAYNVHH